MSNYPLLYSNMPQLIPNISERDLCVGGGEKEVRRATLLCQYAGNIKFTEKLAILLYKIRFHIQHLNIEQLRVVSA